jgi:hypothetical protein
MQYRFKFPFIASRRPCFGECRHLSLLTVDSRFRYLAEDLVQRMLVVPETERVRDEYLAVICLDELVR